MHCNPLLGSVAQFLQVSSHKPERLPRLANLDRRKNQTNRYIYDRWLYLVGGKNPPNHSQWE